LVCRGDLHLWRRFEESDRDHRIDLSAQWEFELVRQTTDLPQDLKWSSSLFRKLKVWAAGKVVASVQSQIGHISNFQGDETVLRVVDVFCCVRCEVNGDERDIDDAIEAIGGISERLLNGINTLLVSLIGTRGAKTESNSS
jgi:hypothetical protein